MASKDTSPPPPSEGMRSRQSPLPKGARPSPRKEASYEEEEGGRLNSLLREMASAANGDFAGDRMMLTPAKQELASGTSTSSRSPPKPLTSTSSPPKANQEVQEPTTLHMAVWLADTKRIAELLEAQADVNQVDNRGATPLMLAAELLPRAKEYEAVLQKLLDNGADPLLRSSTGWSPIDEAVSRGETEIVQRLFEAAQRSQRQRWEVRLQAIVKSLQSLPDFDCTLRWEFESPVVPLLNKFAPSDVWRLRKRGMCLRLDSTLASWKRFRFNKRRELTTLFQANGEGGSPRLYQLNHSKQTVVDITEGLDDREQNAIVADLVAGDCVQWDMQVNSLEVADATTWLGQIAAPVDIHGWTASRFDVKGTVGVVMRKKGNRRAYSTFEEYFGQPLPSNACLPELRQEFSKQPVEMEKVLKVAAHSDGWEENLVEYFNKQVEDMTEDFNDEISTTSEVLKGWPDPVCHRAGDDETQPFAPGNGSWSLSRDRSRTSSLPSVGSAQGNRKRSVGSNPQNQKKPAPQPASDKIGRTTQSVSASVWLATDFAIPMQQFFSVLEALSAEHEAIRRMKELISSQSVKDAADRAQKATSKASGNGAAGSAVHVFPVKVSVPVNLALRAIVHCEAFETKQPGALSQDLFEVPGNYHLVPRCEAQKTLSRSKKRMLLANLAM
mmetsp:Transcript_22827/g.53350  ORF Transcript_22827/g.53350 Transcript_22827/m.53350 type:complete len:669 (+) Transcript_22827:383-2389(+)